MFLFILDVGGLRMEIYKHEYCSSEGRIKTYKIKVEEKPKSYTVIGRNAGVWESRILKEDIGKLDGKYTKKCIRLPMKLPNF